jgi:hypothetical protein
MKRYRLYVDESGDHTYKDIEDPAKRYLGLTACFIESEVYRTQFHPALEALKQAHFPHSPDEPVILHRKDLVNRNGPFWRLRNSENERRFNEDLLQFLSDQDYLLITVVIDKKAHNEIKLKPKSANIAGLQVADLLAYPCKQEILMMEGRIEDPGDMFGHEICRRIAPKYNRRYFNGRVRGYGRVFLE